MAKAGNNRIANKLQTFILLKWLFIAEEEVVQFLGGFFLHVGHDMGVQIHRDGDGGMTKTFRHHLRVFPLLK
jgi:hypothetical protein